MHDEKLRELLQAAQSNQGDVGPLLESYRAYLLLIAEQELPADLRPKLAASDLVQQTVIRACERFYQFQGKSPESLRLWLRTILLNCLIDAQRQQQTRKRKAREQSLGRSSIRRLAEGAQAEDQTSPSAEIQAREAAQALSQAIVELPADYQRVIRLRYQDQRSFNEIAVDLGRSEDAVQKLWARAIRALQKSLEGKHGGNGQR